MKIAIQGGKGSFHHIAVDNMFGDAVYELRPCDSFEELTSIVDKDCLGLMAIENSIAGSLLGNYKLIQEYELVIIAEVYLRIRHQLMVNLDVDLEDINEVHSHPMAFNQCRLFLNNMSTIKRIEKPDTALSAKYIADHKLKNTAAIASRLAGEIYGLKVVGDNIETDKHNYTRFLVVEKRSNSGTLKPSAKANKLTISFELNDEVAALHDVLNHFARLNINLTKIESSPIVGKTWQYMFFVDLILPQGLSREDALQGLDSKAQNIVILGQYEKGIYYDD